MFDHGNRQRDDDPSENDSTAGTAPVTRRSVLAATAGAAAVSAFSTEGAAAPMVAGGGTLFNGDSLIRDGYYDYAPSVMYGDEGYTRMWWCGQGDSGDAVYYASMTESGWTTPQEVMSASSSGWDSAHACDPSVVKGNFSADGSNWDYAMYYGGTDDPGGANTHVGVAFSNDRTSWHKYSGNPVIAPTVGTTYDQYGAGMPTAYREPGTDDTVTVAYFDSSASPNNHYATANDAVTFGSRTDLTADPRSDDAIGDIAYFPDESAWYVTTKNNNDEECYLYKTSNDDLNSTWTECGRITSTLTGNDANHNPCWLRHPNGDLYEEATSRYKYVYFGTGRPRPDTHTWDIGEVRYVDGWEFDEDGDREGWESYNVSLDDGEPTNGTWTVTADQNDPHWVSPSLAINADVTGTVVVRMANQNDDSNGRIYFTTASDGSFSQSKSVGFTADTSGAWTEHRVDMTGNADWTGTVTQLRVDPIENGTGDPLGIDYVRLDA